MEWEGFERPDEIRRYYGVASASGTYSAPERKDHWQGPPHKTIEREYKDHLIEVGFNANTGELRGKPTKLCRHGRASPHSWAKDPTWLIPAWENGQTDRESICGHCWNLLPQERKERLR